MQLRQLSQRPVFLIGAAAAALAVVIGVKVFSATSSPEVARPAAPAARNPLRPIRPPGPDDPRPTVVEPRSPEISNAWKAEMTEKLRGNPAPGEAAFAAYSDRFIDENLAMAEEQARAEGITLPEVRALTRLGLLVMSTQRLADVEEVLGRELPPETKDALEDMVQRENGAFKDQMRAMVAKGASEEQRWDLIRAADARYREEFFKLSGMTPELLDDMLAGNLLLPGAPGATPDPSTLGPGPDSLPEGPKDTVAPQPRPSGAAP
jgi:hypothetical protein